MFIETITYAADKVKNTWAYLETVMPASYNELNDMVMKLVENNNLLGTLYAKLNSPVFTGAPTAPTPANNDNSTKISTTAWVKNNIESLVTGCISAVAVASGFSYSFNTNGYIKLPTWLGGFIMQWGQDAGSTTTFPITFPTACYGVQVTEAGSLSVRIHDEWWYNCNNVTQSGFSSSYANYWLAVGR